MKKLSLIFIGIFLLVAGVNAQNGWYFTHYNENKPIKIEYQKSINKLLLLFNKNDTLALFETGSSADSHGIIRRLQFVAMPSGTILWQERIKAGVLQINDYYMNVFWEKSNTIPGTMYIAIQEVDQEKGTEKTYDICTIAFFKEEE